MKTAAMTGAAACFLRGNAWGYANSPTNLKKFVQHLPGLGPDGANEYGLYIPVASPNTTQFPGADYYKIAVGQYRKQMHPALANSTRLWGYGDATKTTVPDFGYLGPAIVAKAGRPVRITATNNLPSSHILPVDTTICGAERGANRVAVHLHGGFVPWISDGGPRTWFDPYGNVGECFLNNQVLNPGALPGQAEYYYPNQQSARLMWYHDHAMGTTRLNAYAGIAAPYILTDGFENVLQSKGYLPSREIPLVLQDKTFYDGRDRQYERITGAQPGDLWYPYIYEPDRWDVAPNCLPLPVPSCVPEAFFDTIVVNGAVFPYVKVEPRMYRLRILNGSQARFYNLQLYYADNKYPTEANVNAPGPAFLQVGNESGFLPAPVLLNKNTKFSAQFNTQGDYIPGTLKFNLLLAPAERADIIIDFSRCPSGSRLILYNDAPAPFPSGEPLNDYYPGNPDLTIKSKPGYGPNTRTLVQFQVGSLTGAPDEITFQQVQAGLAKMLPGVAPARLHTNVVRELTLNEDSDSYGRLIQRMGTTQQLYDGTYARNYMDPATEVVKAGSTEIWRIFNLTGDTHPIHFHLVNVQIIGRGAFDAATPSFAPVAPLLPPDLNEVGWKETVRVNPCEFIDVIANFALPNVPFKVPPSPCTGGNEYVYHCHILDHEEHDMMRPLVVI
jgi:spore coat protein A